MVQIPGSNEGLAVGEALLGVVCVELGRADALGVTVLDGAAAGRGVSEALDAEARGRADEEGSAEGREAPTMTAGAVGSAGIETACNPLASGVGRTRR